MKYGIRVDPRSEAAKNSNPRAMNKAEGVPCPVVSQNTQSYSSERRIEIRLGEEAEAD